MSLAGLAEKMQTESKQQAIAQRQQTALDRNAKATEDLVKAATGDGIKTKIVDTSSGAMDPSEEFLQRVSATGGI